MSLLLSAVEPAWFFAGLPFQNCLYLFSGCSSPFGAHTNGTVRANGSTHTATSMQVHLLPGSHSRTCTGWDYTVCSAATGTCTTVATRHALGHQYMKRSHCGTSLGSVNSLLLSTVKKTPWGLILVQVYNATLCGTLASVLLPTVEHKVVVDLLLLTVEIFSIRGAFNKGPYSSSFPRLLPSAVEHVSTAGSRTHQSLGLPCGCRTCVWSGWSALPVRCVAQRHWILCDNPTGWVGGVDLLLLTVESSCVGVYPGCMRTKLSCALAQCTPMHPNACPISLKN